MRRLASITGVRRKTSSDVSLQPASASRRRVLFYPLSPFLRRREECLPGPARSEAYNCRWLTASAILARTE